MPSTTSSSALSQIAGGFLVAIGLGASILIGLSWSPRWNAGAAQCWTESRSGCAQLMADIGFAMQRAILFEVGILTGMILLAIGISVSTAATNSVEASPDRRQRMTSANTLVVVGATLILSVVILGSLAP